jgi:hypothetical protein
MATDLERLVELQVVDGELAQLKARLATLPETLKRIDLQLSAARKRVDDARAAIKAGEAAKRSHEQEIKSLNEQIIKFRGQSSSVKNNEQYKALLHEVEHCENGISQYEEKILELMLNADALQATLARAEAALKIESVEIEQVKAEAQKSAEADKAATALAAGRAQLLRKDVDETLLATYDRILKSRGHAMAEVIDHRCTACQVMLRPQALGNLRMGELVHCDSCGRIVYYIPEHNVAKVSAQSSGIQHQAEREWMFVPSLGTQGAFVVFIDHKGNATMKAYDALSGDLIARRSEKNSRCRSIFAEELSEARNLFVDEPALDEKYKEQLPAEVLGELRHQLPNS